MWGESEENMQCSGSGYEPELLSPSTGKYWTEDLMKSVCSFCDAVIREGSGDDDRVSHGICKTCFDEFKARYGFNAKKFLDMFEAPVFLVDDDARVMAANRLAITLAGRAAGLADGRFCGDILSCVNAVLENGCGKTRFCPDCTFRNSVTETYTTGRPVTDRVATLCRRDGDTREGIRMLVSTRKDGDAVLLRLQPVRAAGPAYAE